MLLYDGQTISRVENRCAKDGETAFIALLNPDEATIRQVVGDMHGCHDLILENLMQSGLRPKLHVLHNHAFFPFFFLKENWKVVEVFVVMGSNFVIAILKEEMPILEELELEFSRTPEKMKHPGRLLYEFLDLCIHHYFSFVDSIEDKVDKMESQVYAHPTKTIAPKIFSLKRTLHKRRRILSEERMVIEALMHADFPYTTPDDTVYFADLHEHIRQITDGIDSFRDALSGLLDLQMAMKSDRMNAIMKTLTIVSTFFMPLSFIVGLYGTNLKVPEYGWRFGYEWMWLLILGSVVGLWIFFRRRKWF